MSQAANVVTSENSADFYAQRLGLADAPETVADEQSEPVKDNEQSEPVAHRAESLSSVAAIGVTRTSAPSKNPTPSHNSSRLVWPGSWRA